MPQPTESVTVETNDMIPSLALFTLLAVVAIAVLGYVLFKAKRANRHPMEKSPDGAIVRDADGSVPRPTITATNQAQPGQRDLGGRF